MGSRIEGRGHGHPAVGKGSRPPGLAMPRVGRSQVRGQKWSVMQYFAVGGTLRGRGDGPDNFDFGENASASWTTLDCLVRTVKPSGMAPSEPLPTLSLIVALARAVEDLAVHFFLRRIFQHFAEEVVRREARLGLDLLESL